MRRDKGTAFLTGQSRQCPRDDKTLSGECSPHTLRSCSRKVYPGCTQAIQQGTGGCRGEELRQLLYRNLTHIRDSENAFGGFTRRLLQGING